MQLSYTTLGALLLAFGAFKLLSTAVWALRGGAVWVTIAFTIVAFITLLQGLAMFNFLTNPFIETYVFALIGVFLIVYYVPQFKRTATAWERAIVVGNVAAGAGFLTWAAHAFSKEA